MRRAVCEVLGGELMLMGGQGGFFETNQAEIWVPLCRSGVGPASEGVLLQRLFVKPAP